MLGLRTVFLVWFFNTTFTLRCVWRPYGEHIRNKLMQSTTNRSMTLARDSDRTEGIFNLLDSAVRLCTDCGSLVGQDLDGHKPCKSQGVLCNRRWDREITGQSLVPELLAQSCRGGRHHTNPCHAHPHDPWPVTTQIGRVGIPTAHVPGVRNTNIHWRFSPQRSTQTRPWASDFVNLDQQQRTSSMEHSHLLPGHDLAEHNQSLGTSRASWG